MHKKPGTGYFNRFTIYHQTAICDDWCGWIQVLVGAVGDGLKLRGDGTEILSSCRPSARSNFIGNLT